MEEDMHIQAGKRRSISQHTRTPSPSKRSKCCLHHTPSMALPALTAHLVQSQEQPLEDKSYGGKMRKRKYRDENCHSKRARKTAPVKDEELRCPRVLRTLKTLKDGSDPLCESDASIMRAHAILGKRKRCPDVSEKAAGFGVPDKNLLNVLKRSKGLDAGVLPLDEEYELPVKPKKRVVDVSEANANGRRFVKIKRKNIVTNVGEGNSGEPRVMKIKRKRQFEEMEDDVDNEAKEEMNNRVLSHKRLKTKRGSKGTICRPESPSERLAATKRECDHYLEPDSRKRFKATLEEEEESQHIGLDDKSCMTAERSSPKQAGIIASSEYRKRLRKRTKNEGGMRKRRRTDIVDTEICEKLQQL